MSSASAKTYDVEIWFPSQGRYRETASISNTTDFQARRLGIRIRGEHGPEHVHMLNGTAVVDRMALAILENFQGEVPDVLRVVRRATWPSVQLKPPRGEAGGSRLAVVTSGTCGMGGRARLMDAR